MSLHDSLSNELLARADELMQNAPGRVSVRRISHIDDVKVLRAARAALTDDENEELRNMRLLIMERLDGIVSVVGPPPAEEEKGLLAALFSSVMRAGQKMRAQGEFAHLANAAELPTRLPAPPELLDAFEAWAIANLATGRVDDDVSMLRGPLDEARIEPAAD